MIQRADYSPLDLFDLAQTANEVRVPVPSGRAVRVSVTAAAGTWGTQTLEVKIIPPNTTTRVSFTTPKTIAAGGGSVLITEDEMRGVRELAVVATGTAESTGVLARIGIVADTGL